MRGGVDGGVAIFGGLASVMGRAALPLRRNRWPTVARRRPLLVGCEAPIENAPSGGFASWATGVAAAARASRPLVTPLAATGAADAGATAAVVVGAGAPAPLVSAAELIVAQRGARL